MLVIRASGGMQGFEPLRTLFPQQWAPVRGGGARGFVQRAVQGLRFGLYLLSCAGRVDFRSLKGYLGGVTDLGLKLQDCKLQ